jgi:hypothetical protein
MKQFSPFVLTLILSSAWAFVPPQVPAGSTSSLSSTVDDKTEVREYFNTEGFNRWNKIYSESDDVNSVQLDIRTGHDQTIQKIVNWIAADGDISGKTVCDCGCGVGSLAIPLAQMGELAFGVDDLHFVGLSGGLKRSIFLYFYDQKRSSRRFSFAKSQAPKSLPVIFRIPWPTKLVAVPKKWE